MKSCVEKCPDLYYAKSDPLPLECVLCDSKCKSCTSSDKSSCTAC